MLHYFRNPLAHQPRPRRRKRHEPVRNEFMLRDDDSPDITEDDTEIHTMKDFDEHGLLSNKKLSHDPLDADA